MAYLGNTPTTQSFIAGTDVFNGTGAQVAYTLSRSVNSPNDIEVVVNNVEQNPSSYSAAGTTLTFSAAPSSGTSNIYVRYLSTTLQSIAPSQKTVVPASLSTGGPYWNASGKVGIGTSSPVARLDVRNSDGTADTLVSFGNTNIGSGLQILTSDGNLEWGFNALNSRNLVFQTNQTERVRIDSVGNLKFNSGYGSVATAYGCRAWVNFNGTGTVAIRASGNVSSITDGGVGIYTVNFTTAMPDANYSVVPNNHGQGDHIFVGGVVTYSTTSALMYFGTTGAVGSSANTRVDAANYGVAIFR